MAKRIFIDSSGGNIISALADDKQLLEYHIEKKDISGLVGNIYLGRVENIVNGMQAAFVNLGIGKNGYLNVGDILVDRAEIQESVDLPDKLHLKIGDEILVQIVKDAVGTKGARCSPFISLAGFYLVYMPSFGIVGVSRKITDKKKRDSLTEYVEQLRRDGGGFIVRTKGENAAKRELKSESEYLFRLYDEIIAKRKEASAPALLYEEGDLQTRMLRDVYSNEVQEIVVGDKDIYDSMCALAAKRKDGVRKKMLFFDRKTDMFAHYGLAREVDKLLRNRVDLSSGAYLIIDKTEALTVIDVNTGKYIGDNNLEDTVFDTNMLAATEIARQVRLRNIGGIVIVDFIDMEREEHRSAVLAELEKSLLSDRSKCNVIGMSSLGLVEFTRKKKRRESTAMLVQTCPYCNGDGVIFSSDYIVLKIRIALLDLFADGYESAILDVNAEILNYILKKKLLSNDVKKIWADKRIYVIPHRTFHLEYFICRGDNSKVLELPDKAVLLF